jgi:hypothetical protein
MMYSWCSVMELMHANGSTALGLRLGSVGRCMWAVGSGVFAPGPGVDYSREGTQRTRLQET